jgi:uncharacterized coiled-coil protein SlyX
MQSMENSIDELEEKITFLEKDLKDISEKIRNSRGDERMNYFEEEKKLLTTGIKILKELATK